MTHPDTCQYYYNDVIDIRYLHDGTNELAIDSFVVYVLSNPWKYSLYYIVNGRSSFTKIYTIFVFKVMITSSEYIIIV